MGNSLHFNFAYLQIFSNLAINAYTMYMNENQKPPIFKPLNLTCLNLLAQMHYVYFHRTQYYHNIKHMCYTTIHYTRIRFQSPDQSVKRNAFAAMARQCCKYNIPNLLCSVKYMDYLFIPSIGLQKITSFLTPSQVELVVSANYPTSL